MSIYLEEYVNWKAEREAACSARIDDRNASQALINERDAWIVELIRERGAAARERDALREELEEARTLDRGFYEWMIERDLLQRGEEVEWPDIVIALTEHEIELIDAGDRAAKAGNARQALKQETQS